MMRRTGLAAILVLIVGAFATYAWSAPGESESANGHGALPNSGGADRQFSFNATRQADGTVTGHATLINPAFTGEDGRSPYRLQVDISCMKTVGNIAIMGGMTKRTNDPNLVDAVYFSVQDNGEPGKGRDRISRAFFFDDDPATTGDPQLCLLTGVSDFPLETIESGNIQVR